MSARDRLVVAVMLTALWAFSSWALTAVFSRASKSSKKRAVPAKFQKVRPANVMGDV